MKDASSIPGEYNPNYEERRKKFDPAGTRPSKTLAKHEHRRGKADQDPSATQHSPASGVQSGAVNNNGKTDGTSD